MQSKKRKTLTTFFILRPWGFIFFLLFGAGMFIFFASKIQIPVYTTLETTVIQKNGIVKLNLENKTFKEGTPVFLYKSRDDHLEKVTNYKIKDGCLLIDSSKTLPDSGKIYIDIQTDEISLLLHIFKEGGNT